MKTICFSLGLSDEEIKTCLEAFQEADKGQTELYPIPITEDLLEKTVTDVLAESQTMPDMYVTGQFAPGKKRARGSYRAVVIDSQVKDQVIRIMKSFKHILSDPKDVIFAMITPINLHWTFKNYIQHLTQEHEYMKDRSPRENPDMKRL